MLTLCVDCLPCYLKFSLLLGWRILRACHNLTVRSGSCAWSPSHIVLTEASKVVADEKTFPERYIKTRYPAAYNTNLPAQQIAVNEVTVRISFEINSQTTEFPQVPDKLRYELACQALKNREATLWFHRNIARSCCNTRRLARAHSCLSSELVWNAPEVAHPHKQRRCHFAYGFLQVRVAGVHWLYEAWIL